jgi:hypothetical protein
LEGCEHRPIYFIWRKSIPRREEPYTAARFSHSTSDANVPARRFHRGDTVKLVVHNVAPDGTEGYSIEVFNALGDTIAVTSVSASGLEARRHDEMLCARTL